MPRRTNLRDRSDPREEGAGREPGGREVPPRIGLARYPDDLPAVRGLLQRYRAWLVAHREVTDFDDAILRRGLARFDSEVAGLPEPYAPPKGAFYLAWVAGTPVGSAGLRRVDAESGELKRLFVRDEWRGGQLGRRLVGAVLRRAREIGYRRVVLDTLPTMTRAVQLYQEMGARPIPPYWAHPVPRALFFEFRLE